jgi:hypothetical protein
LLGLAENGLAQIFDLQSQLLESQPSRRTK